MDVSDNNLENELRKDAIVIALLKDKEIATDFYRALCNVDWLKKMQMPEDERIIQKLLTGTDKGMWSCSWRRAGRIIAEIRSEHYNVNEDYMDFYCAGDEGIVKPIVKECLERMGWEPRVYYGDA